VPDLILGYRLVTARAVPVQGDLILPVTIAPPLQPLVGDALAVRG